MSFSKASLLFLALTPAYGSFLSGLRSPPAEGPPSKSAPAVLGVSASHARFGLEGQAWEMTIGQGGKLWFKRPRGGEQLFSIRALSPKALSDLGAALAGERFCDLDEQYGTAIMDGPERQMSARCGDTIRTVTLFTFDPRETRTEAGRSEIRRALRVWIAIRSLFDDPEALDSRPEDRALLERALAPAPPTP